LQSPAEALANVGDEELTKWAGKATLKKALKWLVADPQVQIETEAALVIRFPSRNITCRWIPSGGLLGMVCSCQSETVCEHAVAAVLAYQASLGKRQFALEQRVLKEAAGAPRTRAEVLASVGTVLREMVSLGLARLSAATQQRLTTLAVSAHGVDLPRLERMLTALADEVRVSIRRDAQANTTNLLAQAARTEALRTALVGNPLPALVGVHRTQYHEVGQITLVGLGAQRWRSKGGYHGVTVYFWDQSAKAWATWSDTRPLNQAGFDPAARFQADGPWAGCASPEEASRSVVRLTGAWRNAHGRISGRPGTRALIVAPTSWRDVPGQIALWSDLRDCVLKVFGGSLADRPANGDLVLLMPKVWGPAGYDSLRQELVRLIFDEQGRTLELWLPFTPENETAIELLERHDASQTQGLLAALRLVAGRVRVQPISLFDGDKTIHLNLHQPAVGQVTTIIAAAAEAAEEEQLATEEESLAAAGSATPLGRLLTTAQAELEGLAESGVAARRERDLLINIGKRMEALGLLACAAPVKRLAEGLVSSAKLADAEHRGLVAGELLRCYYVLRLAADEETLAAACAGLR
jgi:hypothetical protein